MFKFGVPEKKWTVDDLPPFPLRAFSFPALAPKPIGSTQVGQQGENGSLLHRRKTRSPAATPKQSGVGLDPFLFPVTGDGVADWQALTQPPTQFPSAFSQKDSWTDKENIGNQNDTTAATKNRPAPPKNPGEAREVLRTLSQALPIWPRIILHALPDETRGPEPDSGAQLTDSLKEAAEDLAAAIAALGEERLKLQKSKATVERMARKNSENLAHIDGLKTKLANAEVRCRELVETNQRLGEVQLDLKERVQNTERESSTWKVKSNEVLKENIRLQENLDLCAKTLNSEKMRRFEAEEKLKYEKIVWQDKANTDLAQSQARYDEVAGRLRQHHLAEKSRREQEMSERELYGETIRDEMMQEIFQNHNAKKDAKRKEKERLEREQEEQKKREEDLKQQEERKAAAEAERARCLKRDERWTARPWSDSSALERFEGVLVDFGKMRFSDSIPLTFEAFPWPVLQKPSTFTAHEVTAAKVVGFFRWVTFRHALLTKESTAAEYKKSLLKQSLLVFHGDKLVHPLSTVADEKLREAIKMAANTVTQVLNDLLQKP
ncbi:hypothetical protein B0H10DRAFT_2211610 [Mycena sp. CBHHK59/15]|nr:hypothetical protein B0H10DRAFT_2211610 [Mycena sp. CBHHK59/15]